MSTNTNTLVSSLSVPHTGVLGTRLAAHLLRRTSFHFTKDRVDELALLTADAAVDLLFDTPSPAPYMPKPLFTDSLSDPILDWIDVNVNDSEARQRRAVYTWWFRNAVFDPTAHHKLAFFLHTTFTTSHDSLVINGNGQNLTQDVSRFLYDHVRLLNWLTQNGTSLKTAARKITLDNLMLGYLNNRLNLYFTDCTLDMNENYAREFLELFTISPGAELSPGIYENYTEADVSAAARIFSGFSTKARRNLSDIDPDTGIPRGTAFPVWHCPDPKVFSDKFGNLTIDGPTMDDELDEFIDMVFDQPATALTYATKLYRYYAAIEIDPVVTQEIADDLLLNGYDYTATLKLFFKSAHFYSICDADPDYSNGNMIKSPIEMLSEAISFFQSDLPPFNDTANPTVQEVYNHFFRFATVYFNNSFGEDIDMLLFAPPAVAGYPAYAQDPTYDRNWYTAGTIPTRFGLGQKWVNDWNVGPNIATRIDSVAYANYLSGLGVDVSDADALVTETLYLFPQAISTDRYNLIKDIFLGDLSPINWLRLWKCYEGDASFCEAMAPGPGDPASILPHLNALVVAVLSAHEFQLK